MESASRTRNWSKITVSELPQFFGTFVPIQDCASIAIDKYVSGEKDTQLCSLLREEAFRYGEHVFDQFLLDRTIEPCLDSE